MKLPALSLACLILGASPIASAQTPREFASWPDGQSPAEIGRRVAARYVADPAHANFGRAGRPERLTYPEVCTWFGALTFAAAAHDEELRAALVKRFEPLLQPTPWPGHPAANHRGLVDERDLAGVVLRVAEERFEEHVVIPSVLKACPGI